ncbi:hypothetical protein HF1_08310 [Mycoplasma haemofelis str. Langford 1]|uniref:Uncharacterized protein n=2 Tax=Mycoplasma haemofelis TaxID=29501 RepID=F6FIX1_MYCHI|nr:hypothetical protein [Mycoplasma haemofelis]AEG73169.1 hypothetical protein MHF_0911 [Mycoplasma haemofelis Ohio2]CBY92839.1 hypothetical protein HF1_08310 [Mycoplasma haemofelis str. Langford 1]
MNPVGKIALSVGTIGGTAAAGGYSWHLSQLSTISSLIEADEEVTQLTSKSADEDWKEAWTTYKGSDVWKLSEHTSDNVPQSFKDECEKRGKQKVKGIDNSEFQNFKKWCSRNFTVSEWLKKSGLSLLETNSESSKWDAAWTKYKAEPKNKKDGSNLAETDVWKVSNWSAEKSKNTASSGFKTKCAEQAKVKIRNKEEELYKQVSNWCV